MHGRRLGSLVGVVGGLAFVLGNLGSTHAPVVAVVLVVAAVAALLVLVARAWVRDTAPPPPPPSRAGLRLYGVAVVAMVVLIPVGSALLGAAGAPELSRCWVVLVVGAHFLPFGRAFGTTVFVGLGAVLVGVSVVGAVAATLGAATAPAWTAVVAGLVLLASAWWGLRTGAGAPSLPRPPG